MIGRIDRPIYVVQTGKGELAVAEEGVAGLGETPAPVGSLGLLAWASKLSPWQLGDASFCRDHGVRWPYMTGSMANGIASVELVSAAAGAGLLGAYGAAGQPIEVIDQAIGRLQRALGDAPFALNLIHSPNEPAHEAAVVELYLQRGVRLVEASAYLDLTPAVVRYRVTGIREDSDGRVIAPNRIIAKASRIEVAGRWFSPPPERYLKQLVAGGQITVEQAAMARRIPMAQDLTAEADSGGHTDNRPAITLIPTLLALRDRLSREYGYQMPLRVGAAGGIATPRSAAAAFAMGAAYIVTGSINQACVESGSSDAVRRMLAETGQADVAMAPAADMFEMGVKLQVLKRGTMFAMRAQRLYEAYRTYGSLEEIPAGERATLEKTIFRASFEEIWRRTCEYFTRFDPAQVEKARCDAKHRMALVFRWYLGLSSRWANAGEQSRQMDYQVWCGPAMGAFNEWARGSFLERVENRNVATVARNILYGAAVVARLNTLRQQGVPISPGWMRVLPQPVQAIKEYVS